MKYKFESEFRIDKPETKSETDRHYDLGTYKDWLEEKLTEAISALMCLQEVNETLDEEGVIYSNTPLHNEIRDIIK